MIVHARIQLLDLDEGGGELIDPRNRNKVTATEGARKYTTSIMKVEDAAINVALRCQAPMSLQQS